MSWRKGEKVRIRGWAQGADMDSSWEAIFARAEMNNDICTIAYDTTGNQAPQVRTPEYHSSLYIGSEFLVRANNLEEDSDEI